MPQGGLKKGEDVDQGAFRELKEEIGTDNAIILAKMQEWLTYEFPNRLIPQLWGGRYRGQNKNGLLCAFAAAMTRSMSTQKIPNSATGNGSL